MSQAVTKIKSRIKSVSSAYKVTSAMKLVSTVKLKQWKGRMIAYKDYINEINETVDILLSYSKRKDIPFMNINTESTKNLYLVVSSTLGLCGSYNNNIFKVSDVAITKDDEAIILGGKGLAHYKNGEFTSIPGYDEYSINDKEMVNKITNYILKEYNKGTYKEVHIIYSEYKNSLVFLAKDFKLLPFEHESKELNGYPPIVEPSEKALLDEIVPFYLRSEIYAKLFESAVCEQAARSNAMENATNNAKDLLDELKIEFNKARQTAITQEIIEIVAASKGV